MISQGFLQLSDDAFWASKLDLQPFIRQLMMSGTEGFFLDAPRAADVRARTSLPVALFAVVSARVAADWNYRDNLLIVACDVERGQCLADRAAPVERPILRPSGNSAAGDGEDGHVGNKTILDARRRLQLPWKPGTWQLLLVTRERRSEPVRVVLHEGGTVTPAPEPLAGARLALTGAGQGLETVLDVELKVRASKGALGAGGAGGDVPVPVTFVVTGHAQPIPYVVQRAAPGRWGAAPGPEHVTASLHVALKDLVPAGVGADTYYVWAFAGDQVSEPLRVVVPGPRASGASSR